MAKSNISCHTTLDPGLLDHIAAAQRKADLLYKEATGTGRKKGENEEKAGITFPASVLPSWRRTV